MDINKLNLYKSLFVYPDLNILMVSLKYQGLNVIRDIISEDK